ncbi:MAG: creatininase family protein [Planctomycetales bacterium]|nr:creatininase family protein [Planctomycetales bacterium]MCA9224942.1 creatininase family protein [Planctomycetales bacterium]
MASDHPPEVLLRKLTRREFRQRMDSGELRACIIPVAAIEQHLEHLAMEHDWASVTHVAKGVAERLRPNVLVAEGLMCGISEHHMKHPGTLTISAGTFLTVLGELIDSMVRAGFDNILVLNGHGGNVVPCRAVWDQYLRRFQVNLHFLPYWDVLTVDDAKELLDSGHVLPTNLPGHAQEFETSFALAAFPENVRTEMWTDQPDPTPAMATAAKGEAFIARSVERVAAFLEDMIAGRRTAPVPPFHP